MSDRAIIFDFDGVIVDSEATWFQAWHEAFASRGHELRPETYAACIGTIGLEPVDELRALTGLDLSRELLAIDERAWELTRELSMLPGIAGLIEEIDEARLPRAIASSSDRQWVEDLLEHLGIAQGWAHVACADGDRERAKPDPALYLEALDAIGIPTRDVLALEDSPNGILAAKGAGLFCVAVPCALTASLDLSAADTELPSLAGIKLEDLLSLLE